MRASPFVLAWGDMLLGLALKGFSSARYWAAHKLLGTPARGHKHNRPAYLQRYSAKRVTG